MVASEGARRPVMWNDSATSVLLEALKVRESLWNSKSHQYKDKNIKKREYEEILSILREDMPNVDLTSLKGINNIFCFGKI